MVPTFTSLPGTTSITSVIIPLTSTAPTIPPIRECGPGNLNKRKLYKIHYISLK